MNKKEEKELIERVRIAIEKGGEEGRLLKFAVEHCYETGRCEGMRQAKAMLRETAEGMGYNVEGG